MNNISPSQWGPTFWRMFHIVAFGFPDKPSDEDKKYYLNFYDSLPDVIPCVICRKHFKIMLSGSFKLTDDIISNREKLIKWSYDVHDYVNQKKKVNVEWARTKSPPYNIFHKYYDSLLV